MAYETHHDSRNKPAILLLSLLALAGVILDLIGTAMQGAPGILWWDFAYYTFTTIVLFYFAATANTHRNNYLLPALLIAIALAYLPGDISNALSVSSSDSAFLPQDSTQVKGAKVRAAGLITLAVSFFLLLFPLSINDWDT
ncbi:hypothetical protein HDU91_002298, partial [Kappamyces sp. JEL0680]